jgi:DNA-binding GntR family transcriptional regulator
VVFSIDILERALWPAAEAEGERLRSESLYDLLRSRLGLIVDHGVAWRAPARATAAIAARLQVAEGALLLCLTQTDYDAASRPLVFSREYHLPGAFDFVVWRRGPDR